MNFTYSPKFKNVLGVFVGSTLFVGIALTIFGVKKTLLQFSLPWLDARTLIWFLSFYCATNILIVILAKIYRRNVYVLVGPLICCLAAISGALASLLFVMLFILASEILGFWILRAIESKKSNFVYSFLIGAGFYGTIVGLIAHFPINYIGVYVVALVIPILVGGRKLVVRYKELVANLVAVKIFQFKRDSLDIAIISISMIYFIVALMPELGFDSLSMHLFVPAHMNFQHRWGFDAGNYVWAVMPMLGDWIYSIAYLLGGEDSARLFNVLFILILCYLLSELVKWARGSSNAKKWATLIFLSTPLTFTEGSSLYVESIWASFLIAGSLATLELCSDTSSSESKLPFIGFFMGFAVATKTITLLAVPSLLLLLILRKKLWLRLIFLKSILIGFIVFIFIGCIPYVTAFLATKNPVFPFFNKIFKSPFYPSSENFRSSYGSGLSWDVIYQVTFDSGKFLEASAGAPGFQWMLILIPAVVTLAAYRNVRAICILLMGLITFLFIFNTQGYLRYVFPLFILFIAAIGVVFDSEIFTNRLLGYLWKLAVVLTIALNLLFINSGNGFYMDFPLKVVFDNSIRDKYLYFRMPIRSAVKMVNTLNIGNTPVAIFAEPLAAGLTSNALYPNWYNTSFQSEVSKFATERDVIKILDKRGVEYIILDANWNGVNCCGDGQKIQLLIERATEEIASFGQFSVRKIRADFRVHNELLVNPNFSSVEHWNLTPGVKFNKVEKSVVVSVSSPVSQSIHVIQGAHYSNEVTARCNKESADGRIQVNWHDLKDNYISSNIKVFGCKPEWQKYTMNIVAPPNAASAVVYASGHSSIPLEFKSVSFYQ